MASPTPNKGMTYPAHGGAVDAWDTPLNQNFDQLDQNLGGSYNIVLSSTTAAVTYNSTFATAPSTVSALTLGSTGVAQNLNYVVSGTIGANLTISFPGVGGFYALTNDSSGAFSVTVNTVTAGSSGTTVAQGFRAFVVADGTNVRQADNSQAAQFYSYLGNPNGNISGTEASANGGLTNAVWDVTNQQLYVVTTTGSTATAVWTPQLARIQPQGYLTTTSNTNNVINTSDATGVSTLYYTPYLGNMLPMSDGTTLFLRTFSQLTMSLTASHAASNIYDLYVFLDGTTVTIGTGPTWSAGTGGSVTVGAATRGTGAGGAAIQRLNGVWVNTAAMTMTNGVNTYSVSALLGTCIGTIMINATQGQITCHRSAGQSRIWGLSNMYNKQPLGLTVQDPSTSWSLTSATIQPTNGNSSNNALVVLGSVAEESLTANYIQAGTGSAGGSDVKIGIGWNSTSAFSGTIGRFSGSVSGGAMYNSVPAAGPQRITSLEQLAGGSAYTMYGSASNGGSGMTLTWRG